jgi:hypothetical protein
MVGKVGWVEVTYWDTHTHTPTPTPTPTITRTVRVLVHRSVDESDVNLFSPLLADRII